MALCSAPATTCRTPSGATREGCRPCWHRAVGRALIQDSQITESPSLAFRWRRPSVARNRATAPSTGFPVPASTTRMRTSVDAGGVMAGAPATAGAGVEAASAAPDSRVIPGTTDTELSRPFQGNVPEGKLFQADFAARCILEQVARFGPASSGSFWGWDGERIEW